MCSSKNSSPEPDGELSNSKKEEEEEDDEEDDSNIEHPFIPSKQHFCYREQNSYTLAWVIRSGACVVLCNLGK